MHSGKIVLGVAIGTAVGTALGVLFAPAKGSVTRKRIQRKGAGCVEDAQEKFNEYTDAMGEAFDTTKKGAMDLVEKGRKNAASMAETIHT